jgi:hypothetical protein
MAIGRPNKRLPQDTVGIIQRVRSVFAGKCHAEPGRMAVKITDLEILQNAA